MPFITSTDDVVFDTASLSGFRRKGDEYVASDTYRLRALFETWEVDELLKSQVPIIPCTGEFMALVALKDDDGGLRVLQSLSWRGG